MSYNEAPMRVLMVQMSKAKRHGGFVVFTVSAAVPVPLPMAGRPNATREDAEARAQAQLERGALAAWTVGRDGITRHARTS